jgi:predicted NodU family carbamoyl transferase
VVDVGAGGLDSAAVTAIVGLNTFNAHEPIVMSPQLAVETFEKTRMALLVLGNHVVRRGDGAA